MPQLLEGNANFVLVATASAFLAVGFSRPNTKAHDEFKSEFIVATKAFPNIFIYHCSMFIFHLSLNGMSNHVDASPKEN
jgi:hypothetical protein